MTSKKEQSNDSGLERGMTLGAVLAAIISYNEYHSFWWMLIHCICSWFYIIWHFWFGPGST